MPQTTYTVIATLPDAPTAAEYTTWLADGHIQAVLAAGASAAQLVQSEDPPLQVECRYLFPSRDAYDRYIRDAAPRLRAEGLARFPAARGITFQRRVGTVLA